MMKRVGHWWVPTQETQQVSALEVGMWQPDHLAECLSHVRGWTRAIDGGAHVGTWTLGQGAMAEKFETVIMFEPAPDTFACLERNVGEWRERNPNSKTKLSLRNEALGNGFGLAGLAEDTKYYGGNTGGRYIAAGHSVKLRPLDSLNLQVVDFVKLDVEGYELFALQGAEATIRRCKPVVMIEDKHRMAHRYGYAPGAAADFLVQRLGMAHVGGIGSDKVFGWSA